MQTYGGQRSAAVLKRLHECEFLEDLNRVRVRASAGVEDVQGGCLQFS